MRFTYYYKTSDNVRHEAEISAPSRDEAFAALRDRGIRPIKVVAADSQRDGSASRGGGRRIVAYALSVAFALLAADVLQGEGDADYMSNVTRNAAE